MKIDFNKVKQLLSVHGLLRPQRIEDWKGDFQLPDDLIAFYSEVGPDDLQIVSYGNPFFLPSLAGLWSFQAGYRWDGLSGERIDDWDDDWIVVASDGTGAFILSRVSGTVSYAFHGPDLLKPEKLFPDVLVMAACLGVVGGVIRDAGSDLCDEDVLMRPMYMDRIYHELTEIVGNEDEAKVIMTTLGF